MDLSVIRKSQLIPFRGVPLPNYFLKNMEKVGEFEADKTDVLIATYPKAGTTWMQEIVDCVLHGGDVRQCEQSPIHYRSPFLEASYPGIRTGLELLAEIPSPKPIKTHLPFQLIPTSFLQKQCKIIYCARNAKDNVVSSFHFDRMSKLKPDPGPWEEFLQKFLTGNVMYGLWHDHVKGWWEQRGNFPILYMFYEDMKELKTGVGGHNVSDPLTHTHCRSTLPGQAGSGLDIPHAPSSTISGRTYSHCIRKLWNTPSLPNWPVLLLTKSKSASLFHCPVSQQDPRREIKRVAEFLGKELGSKELDTIVAHTSFNAMKLNPMTNHSNVPLDVLDQRISSFMRKGIVGDWKTHFTVAQNQMFEEDYCRRMVGSTLRFRTELSPGDNCLQ
eukprot:gi/632969661/ref/XP_007901202.1/ PREDICTED: sulfotransferase 1A1-like [Callorhinchus milii]